ncbi:hypothetical protein VTN00DRAFT_10116 [Thermoascus crustaceus]|uniref:uncharacterized protein n=1 Tax=Thermoascus crustaceus TaxID=5088 RepID=UPI0037443E18
MVKASVYLLFLIPLALIAIHVWVSPYTKVEESFHIQAIHDIATYGIPLKDIQDKFRAQYDHFSFPGAVPRTFIGALVIAGFLRLELLRESVLTRQLIARWGLGLFNGYSLLSYAEGLQRAFGTTTSTWYILFLASQFHVIYYATRTLSNMFAFGITTLALRYLLPEPVAAEKYSKRCRLSLYLMTVAGIIFRSEIALLLAAHTIFLFVAGRISIRREIIPAGVSGLLIGLMLTLAVDSFFWQQFPLWPELAAFKFNVISGQASAWGTHPWHFYFSNALPRLLLNPLTYLVGIPSALFHVATRRNALYILVPSLAYIAIYSLQPHKEWRFIIYTIPPLTAVSALGTAYIWTHRTKSILYRLLSFLIILSTLASFLVSNFILLPISAANYPGAYALNALHAHAHNTKPTISVHLGNLACQTGVTRFLQLPPPEKPLVYLPGSPDGSIPPLRSGSSLWKYDKTENETIKSSPGFWEQFDYVLAEPDEEAKIRSLAEDSDGDKRWEVVNVVDGFAGVNILRPAEGTGTGGKFEEELFGKILGRKGAELWRFGVEMARRYVTKGWWAEVRMEPKIKILKRVR